MKTKEEKALAIAQAEGWYISNGVFDDEVWKYKYADIGDEFTEAEVISDYLNYRGLMPIVFKNLDKIDLCCYYTFQSEQEILDALLDAVYFVLVESKENE